MLKTLPDCCSQYCLKRKVLMDDTNGLAWRNRKYNTPAVNDTEDIRRVRKKAPCTRPEFQ
ncbi:unnamed protein product [Prunus armeniaca]|uniref:Uncharacterized protein n=1 Tax=Prunus armeniaca TaxID=36596 RepID=A0A6J5XUX8_PRUAR|nr:unnamed protein product [Prunus armeniaca]